MCEFAKNPDANRIQCLYHMSSFERAVKLTNLSPVCLFNYDYPNKISAIIQLCVILLMNKI